MKKTILINEKGRSSLETLTDRIVAVRYFYSELTGKWVTKVKLKYNKDYIYTAFETEEGASGERDRILEEIKYVEINNHDNERESRLFLNTEYISGCRVCPKRDSDIWLTKILVDEMEDFIYIKAGNEEEALENRKFIMENL